MIEFRNRVRFRHPLVRSAVYRSATAAEQREVHQALADATDPDLDPDRRAWHRACAAVAPDEQVAAELEAFADRSVSLGGMAAAAAFLETAAALTPDPARRAWRSLAAAQAKATAGAFGDALSLLAGAEAGPLDEAGQAQIDLLHAPDLVQLKPRQRGAAAAPGRRPPARTAGAEPGPGDLPGRAVRRAVRRAPGLRPWRWSWPRPAPGGAGRAGGAPAAGAGQGRSAARRDGGAVHRRVRGIGTPAAPGRAGVRPRGPHRG